MADFLIGARGAGEPMLPIRFAFPNSSALLDHIQKQHIAGLQRIEGLAALAGISGRPSSNRGERPYYPHATKNDDGSITTFFPLPNKEYSAKEIKQLANKWRISPDDICANLQIDGTPNGAFTPTLEETIWPPLVYPERYRHRKK